MDNPFWRDVLKAWAVFKSKTLVKEHMDSVNEPLWYNPKCNTENLYIHSWFRKGVRSIRDLLNNEGRPWSFQEFKEIFQVKGTILDYARVLHCIPNEWLNYSAFKWEEFTPRVEKALKHVLACTKGTRALYDVLCANNGTVPSQEKWQSNLEQYDVQISSKRWTDFYKLPWKCTKSTQLQSMQYKINHRFLVTNRLLFHMTFRDDDLCSLCHTERETIQHLFVECPHTRTLWNNIQEWMTRHMRCNIMLSETDILFGKLDCNNLINHLLLLAKHYVYCARLSDSELNIVAIVNIFKHTFKIERLFAKCNMKNDLFVRKWAPLYDLFNTDDAVE